MESLIPTGERPGSLHGLRVIEISTSVAGPMAAMILGDLGAEVVKVERVGAGDDTRSWNPPAWNGVSTPVTGLFFGGSTQIIAQLLEAVSVGVVVFGLSYALFTALKRVGLLRSRAEDEIAGLDLPEMGSAGYVPGDISVPGGEVTHVPTPAPAPAVGAD